jgi:hypothetical protein
MNITFNVSLDDKTSKVFVAHPSRHKLQDPDTDEESVLNEAWNLIEPQVETWIREITIMNKIKTRANKEFHPQSNRIGTRGARQDMTSTT